MKPEKYDGKYDQIARSLEGIQTIETVENRLRINRTRAIYLIHKLRKLGYVKTRHAPDKRRIYSISLSNKLKGGGTSYTEAINKNAPPALRIMTSRPYYVHGREPSPEEALVYALKQNEIRYVISSLILFRKIKNWPLLYKMARKENLVRQIAALYDVSRLFVKKVRKMPKRFGTLAKPKQKDAFVHIIRPFSSNDFKTIERRWKVYIPLNRADLEEYPR